MLVFGLVCGFLAVWTLQAIHAHSRAVATGAPSGGAWRIMAIAPIAVVAVTFVFLVGGRVATPGATFERYVNAWLEGDAATAASLFAEPLAADDLARSWSADEARLTERLAALAPPDAGSAQPPGTALSFASVRFEYPRDAPPDPSRSQVDLLIVENVRVPSTLLGILPASVPQTRVVARAGRAFLRREPVGPSLPFLPAADVWRIERVEID